ncbi:MAG: AAA-like domain-containing protein [Nostoc sp. JL34]|nr:AAA-like domain-containing protein [Nostoc sp. JL34]
MKKIVTTTASMRLERMQAYKFHSMGLINLSGNEVTISCKLYLLYFCDRFISLD